MKLSIFDKPVKQEVKIRISTGVSSNYETKLVVEFKRLSDTARDALKKEIADRLPGDSPEVVEKRANEFFDAIILGVEGIENDDGSQLNPQDGLKAARNYSGLFIAILEQIGESSSNYRVKN